MSRQAQFLAAYTRIEEQLRRVADQRAASRSDELIDAAAERSPIVRRYKRDLITLRSLRNALVHTAWQGGPIAEPVPAVMRQIELIASQLERPPPLPKQLLMSPKIFNRFDSIGSALTHMKAHAFSQVPIGGEGHDTSLLTSNTVARWLAASLDDDIVELSSTTIARVLEFAEPEVDGVSFASTKADCADVMQRFQQAVPRINVLLLTAGGKADQNIGGIVTTADIPLLLNTLEDSGPVR